MFQITQSLIFSLVLMTIALNTPVVAAPQIDSNRWISPSDICIGPSPAGMGAEIQVTLHCATQLPSPVDLSVEMLIAVNGGTVLNVPVVLAGPIGGGGGQTCGGSTCSVNLCPAGVECIDMTQVGGLGCACDNPVSPGTSILALVPGDTVKVTLVAAVGSIGELYTDDDCAEVVFEGFFDSSCNGDGGDQMGCTKLPLHEQRARRNRRRLPQQRGDLDAPRRDRRPLGLASRGLDDGPALHAQRRTGPRDQRAAVGQTRSRRRTPRNACFGQNSGVPAGDRDGLRCIVQSVQRHGNRQTNASGEIDASSGPNRVWGGEAQPNAGIAAASGFAAGQTRYFQVTHRDDPLAVCMRGLNTSQALEVTFTP